jgi:hypothetical protein
MCLRHDTFFGKYESREDVICFVPIRLICTQHIRISAFSVSHSVPAVGRRINESSGLDYCLLSALWGKKVVSKYRPKFSIVIKGIVTVIYWINIPNLCTFSHTQFAFHEENCKMSPFGL